MSSKFQEIAAQRAFSKESSRTLNEQKREAKAARSAFKARSALSRHVSEQLRLEWEGAWVAEQQRRGGFEKKLQSNEAWWPAALEVMREAEAQNALLIDVLGRRLQLEIEVSDHLTEMALLSTPGLAFDGSFGSRAGTGGATVPTAVGSGRGSAIAVDERARIASLAAAASASADLSPGRVLAVLGAEAATEGLRRRRVSLLCKDALLKDRLDPMAKDFAVVVASTHSSGEGLLKSGREVHSQVREAFDKYDSVARALVKAFANPTQAQNAAAAEAVSSPSNRQVSASSEKETTKAATGQETHSNGPATGDSGVAAAATAATAAAVTRRPVDARRAANASAAAEVVRVSEGLKSLAATPANAAAAAAAAAASASEGSPLSSFALVPCSATPEDEDAWLCELRWRTSVGWQGSLFREATRRFRAKYEALHKAEHNRRVVWARTLEVWKMAVVRSHGLAAVAAGAHKPSAFTQLVSPFSDSLGRAVAEAAGDPSNTHRELMDAIRRRVGVCLMDLLPDLAVPTPTSSAAATEQTAAAAAAATAAAADVDTFPSGGAGSGGGLSGGLKKEVGDDAEEEEEEGSPQPEDSHPSKGVDEDAPQENELEANAPPTTATLFEGHVEGALVGTEVEGKTSPLPEERTMDEDSDSNNKKATVESEGDDERATTPANKEEGTVSAKGEGGGVGSSGVREAPPTQQQRETRKQQHGPKSEKNGPLREYSPLQNNAMVLRCSVLEHRVYYGAGLLSSWEPVLAVLTLQANLLLIPVPKAAYANAQRRADNRAVAQALQQQQRARLLKQQQQQQQQQRALAAAASSGSSARDSSGSGGNLLQVAAHGLFSLVTTTTPTPAAATAAAAAAAAAVHGAKPLPTSSPAPISTSPSPLPTSLSSTSSPPLPPLLPLPLRPAQPSAPPAYLVLAEVLAGMDPCSPLHAQQGTSKAAEAAARARADVAARSPTAALPPLPAPLALATPAVVVANVASVHWAPTASRCGCALDITELLHNSSPLGSAGFIGSLLPAGLVSLHGSRVVGLKAKTQAQCFEWITILRELSEQIQKATPPATR